MYFIHTINYVYILFSKNLKDSKIWKVMKLKEPTTWAIQVWCPSLDFPLYLSPRSSSRACMSSHQVFFFNPFIKKKYLHFLYLALSVWGQMAYSIWKQYGLLLEETKRINQMLNGMEYVPLDGNSFYWQEQTNHNVLFPYN